MASKDTPKVRTCGTMAVHERLLRSDPSYMAARARSEMAQWEAMARGGPMGRVGVTTIPVVVHVVWNTATQNISDAQIQSQIDVLNHDFRMTNPDAANTPAPFAPLVADARLQFVLASTDPAGDVTSGITRTNTASASFIDDDKVKFAASGGVDAWPRDDYLNIWVCQLGNGLLGYAQFPGGAAATDGVVILHSAFGTIGTATAPFNLGRTTTHEIGHWLNLRHIWGDDGTACLGDDFVADTPNAAGPNLGTPAFPHVTCGNGPNGDLFMNYMDYTDDNSMYMFTHGQVDRLQTSLDVDRPTIGVPTNVAPTVDAGPDQTANEGSVATVTVVVTDPDTGDLVTLTVSWGDGTPDTVLPGLPTGVYTIQHVYADEGTHTVTVTAVDASGASGSDSLVVTVMNVAPTVATPTFAPAQPWPGQDVVVTAQFTDPGWKDTHTATVDWGDGTPPTTATVAETNAPSQAAGTVTAHHHYAVPGTYTVTVCVADEDGATGCASATLKVELSPAMPGIMDTTSNITFLTWTGALPGTTASAEAQWRAGYGAAARRWIYEADGWLYIFQATTNDTPNFNPDLPEAIPGNWLAIAVSKDLFQHWFWCGITIIGPTGQSTSGCHPDYGPPPEGAGLLHPWVVARITQGHAHIFAVLQQLFG